VRAELAASRQLRVAEGAVQSAFGSAKVSGRDELRPEDIDLQRGNRKSRIGF